MKPPVNSKYYTGFISLFKRVGKLSLKRILLLNDIEKMEQENDATGYPSPIEMCSHDSFLILASIYHNNPDLFIDDTTFDQKNEMKLVREGREWSACNDLFIDETTPGQEYGVKLIQEGRTWIMCDDF